MNTTSAWRLRRGTVFGALLLLLLALSFLPPLLGRTSAGELEERRVAVGLKLFPTMLAADRDIADKRSARGDLLLLVVYADDRRQAELVVEHLNAIPEVRGLSVRAEAVRHSDLGRSERPVAGLFLAEPLPTGPEPVVRFARARGILAFSPYEGDVERGMGGGISVTERILPYVNREALAAAGVRIKSFYLRIADVYE